MYLYIHRVFIPAFPPHTLSIILVQHSTVYTATPIVMNTTKENCHYQYHMLNCLLPIVYCRGVQRAASEDVPDLKLWEPAKRIWN